MNQPSWIKAIVIIGALVGALFFNGCATVVRGSSEKVVFQTDPAGAEVKLSTGQYGITPCTLVLQRKGNVQVTIRKDGYKEINTTLISAIDGASVGIGTAANFLFLPIVNDIVDYKTGANYSHKPNPLTVKLIPLGATEDYRMVAPTPAAAGVQSEKSADVVPAKPEPTIKEQVPISPAAAKP